MRRFGSSLGVIAGIGLATARAWAADGDLDGTFGVGGIALDTALYPVQPAVAVQSDDKLVLCDSTPVLLAGQEVYVARFEPDGTPDDSFGTEGAVTFTFEVDGAPVDSYCTAIAVQKDGGIVLAGYGSIPGFPLDGPAEFAVARIQSDGTLDPSFGAGTGRVTFPFDGLESASIWALAIDSAGDIVVSGSALSSNHHYNFAIARLLNDGSFDPEFATAGRFALDGGYGYTVGTGVTIDAHGRIVVAGFDADGGTVMRLTSSGVLDSSFGDGGIAMAVLGVQGIDAASFSSVLIDHDQRIVAAGISHNIVNAIDNWDMLAERFGDDGTIDSGFGEDGVSVIPFDLADAGEGVDQASAIVEQSDGKLVLVGQAEYGDQGNRLAAAARLDENGALDATFAQGGKNTFEMGLGDGASQWLTGAVEQKGRVVAVGGVTLLNDSSVWGDVLIRLDADRIFVGAFD